MPRLARHKVTGVFYNDFQRAEREAGAVLQNIARAGLNPNEYTEIDIGVQDYDEIEQWFFAAARAAARDQDAVRDAAWEKAKPKLRAMLQAAGLTAEERAEFMRRVLNE